MNLYKDRTKNFFAVILCLLASVYSSADASSGTPVCLEISNTVSKLPENEKLKVVFDLQWKYWMSQFPEDATYTGESGYNHLWTDFSLTARENRKKTKKCFLKILQGINQSKIDSNEQMNLELAIYGLNLDIEADKYPQEYFVLDQMSGLHLEIVDLLDAAPKATVADYEDRLKRLSAVPVVANQMIDLMIEGIKQKYVPVKFLIEKVPTQIEELIPSNIESSPIYKIFLEMPAGLTDGQKIKETAKTLIEKDVYPALKKLQQFVVNEYIPKCRKEISFSSLPNGKDWYSFLVRKHTTTAMTPDQIHNLGLAEVARIKLEMEKIKDQVKFKGNTKDFHEFLRTSPEFFFSKPKELISAYREIGKRIDPELIKLFGVLPRLPYGVREMPSYKSAQAPTAYYIPGSAKAGRAGFFEANTYDLNSRPKWEMEVLTLHEAVPGHHLQISIAQELGELPEFRKHEGYTSFVEGWGLYAESLGDDLGLYTDPYSKYGQLSYEMWRAVRLVVDTGMHVKSWSREKALDYFMDNTPKSRLQAENEIDRYITWPGQALAYKIGQIKFSELKAMAKKKLKDKYNPKDFHDEVLRHGAIPLDVLEKKFNEWLNQQRL